ncbi:MAG: IS21-like element helper ATPase IstB [Elusimicrobiota bacterium]|jgi:DNA replication protein DnaC
MLLEQTVETLNAMKLHGMARSLPERLGNPKQAELSHAEFVGLLTADEKAYRDNRRLQILLRNARLRQPAALEDVDTRHPRGLNRQVLAELSDIRWINAHRNILFSGPTGIGKSWLACALGNFAARAGYTVLYVRAPRLFETLMQAKGDGTHLKVLARIAKVQVLIVDDFLISPLSEAERRDFLEIVEDRYGAGSTVVTSQLPAKDWHKAIADPTIADAICDRLQHNAYKIELRGESIRKVKGEKS